ncbi:PilW family protein [Moraxella lincolnii]|uniref:PilW family protein n=1 Tax=Lwoffella lincolnii TaxID=90241 RepID=UPI0009925540|nr:PilW family protein [Moraxella lincolnii]
MQQQQWRQYGYPTVSQPNISQGFTLIELMIALVLGLLISAAVLQVYLSAFRTSLVQQGGSEIADASVFGIQNLERQIRLANLGNSVFQINQTTKFGGVVLSAQNVGLPANDSSISDNLMTTSADSPPQNTASSRNSTWTGGSGTNIASDQLTIQYQNVIDSGLVDCEGNTVALNDWVIERYFIRGNGIFTCDAGRVESAGGINKTASVPAFGNEGVALIDNVEQFKVLLGVQSKDANNLAYIAPKNYLALPTSDPLYQAPIIAVKLGFLVRSNHVIPESTGNKYTIFGKENTVSSQSNFLRRNYESTIMLRNARVITP